MGGCGRSVTGEGLALLVLGARGCVTTGALLGVADPLEALLAPDKLAHLARGLLGAPHPGHLGHRHGHHLPERHLQSAAGAGALLCNCDPPADWLATDPTDCWPGFNTGLVSAWRASVAPLCPTDDCQAVTGYKRVL